MKFRYFACFLALHLIPVWSSDYFLTQDGPVHLANAWSFFHYDDASNAVLREYYLRNPLPAPNWLVQAVMVLLMQLLQPEVANKLVVSAFVLLLPGSVWYAAESLRKGAGPAAILSCPLIFTWLLNTGLYNYCMGVAISILLFGYWLRIRDRVDLARTSLMAAGMVALYFTHIFALATFGVMIAITVAIDRRWFDRSTFATAAAAVPAVGLAMFFVFMKRARVGAPVNSTQDLMGRFDALFDQVSFVSYQPEEAWLFTAFFVVLGLNFALVVARVVQRRDWLSARFFAIPAAFLTLYLFMPSWALQGAFIPQRLLYVTSLTMIVTIGLDRPKPASQWGFGILASVISVLLIAVQIDSLSLQNARADDVLACTRELEPGSTLLPVTSPAKEETLTLGRLDSLKHVTHYRVMDLGIVNLGNFSAYAGNHPMVYRPERAPQPTVGCVDCRPAAFDIPGFEDATGGRVDYVLAVGRDAAAHVGDDFVSECVRDHYEHVELFRRKSRLN